MKKRPIAKKTYDPHTAFLAADAFRVLATRFLQSLPRGADPAVDYAMRDLGGLIASATTMALSVELYLKGLRILVGMPVPETHHLWSLYKQLPGDLKLAIEEHYRSIAIPLETEADAASLEIAVSVGPATDETLAELDSKESGPTDNSLPSVLKRCSHAFQTWRYIHEGGVPGSIALYRYEFHYLGRVAEALRFQMLQGLTVRIIP